MSPFLHFCPPKEFPSVNGKTNYEKQNYGYFHFKKNTIQTVGIPLFWKFSNKSHELRIARSKIVWCFSIFIASKVNAKSHANEYHLNKYCELFLVEDEKIRKWIENFRKWKISCTHTLLIDQIDYDTRVHTENQKLHHFHQHI